FDNGSVKLIQSVDVRQYLVQVVPELANLVVRQLQVREVGHVADLLLSDLHPAAFFLACLYTMRSMRSGMLSASSWDVRACATCGGRRGVARPTSTSVT